MAAEIEDLSGEAMALMRTMKELLTELDSDPRGRDVVERLVWLLMDTQRETISILSRLAIEVQRHRTAETHFIGER